MTNLMTLDKTVRISCEESHGLFSFDSTGHAFGKGEYLDFITYRNLPLDQDSRYRLSFLARGNGKITTYLYGNTKSGSYTDNAHQVELTEDWHAYEQTLAPSAIPSPGSFAFRAWEHVKGEVTDLQLIKIF